MKFVPIVVEQHKDIIIPFRRDSFIVSFGKGEDFGSEEKYLKWLQRQTEEFSQGFVLLVDNEAPIGQVEMAIREYKGTSIGYVHLFYLVPEKRGNGLGKVLLNYAIEFFKNHQVCEYHLRVSPTNHPARSFYQKNGLMEIGPELDGKLIRMKGLI